MSVVERKKVQVGNDQEIANRKVGNDQKSRFKVVLMFVNALGSKNIQEL